MRTRSKKKTRTKKQEANKWNWKKIAIKTALVGVGLFFFGGISFEAGLAEGLRQGARRFFYYYVVNRA